MSRAPVFQTDDLFDEPTYHYGPVNPCQCEQPEYDRQWRCLRCHRKLSLEARTRIDGKDRRALNANGERVDK